jgi:hypothetical protein
MANPRNARLSFNKRQQRFVNPYAYNKYSIVCNKSPLFYNSAHCKKYRYLSPTPLFQYGIAAYCGKHSTVSHIIYEFYTYDELSTTQNLVSQSFFRLNATDFLYNGLADRNNCFRQPEPDCNTKDVSKLFSFCLTVWEML